jgi:hypothetical protein
MKEALYPLDRRLVRPFNKFGFCGEEISFFVFAGN